MCTRISLHKAVLTCSLLLLLNSVALGNDHSGEAQWKSWLPAGWKFLASATGDLNQDGMSDAVLLFEEDNPKKRPGDSIGNAAREANFNARRLLVLFQTAS